ncbi:MAG: HAD hydrolase-like protein [Candidatus Moraniibacteriota bacterium]
MKYFFDFDDFFLNTENDLVTDFFRFLMSVTGATKADLDETYKRFSGAHFSKGIPYSLEQHIDFIRELRAFDAESVKADTRAFFADLTKYVFEGTEEFLESLPKEDVYLLTYGEQGFQDLKVNGSGLKKYFHEVIVTQGNKPEEIERIAKRDHFLPQEKVVFGDNRCGHFSGAKERGIITVHLKRETDKYSKDPCEGCQYTVENFDEMLNILDTLY